MIALELHHGFVMTVQFKDIMLKTMDAKSRRRNVQTAQRPIISRNPRGSRGSAATFTLVWRKPPQTPFAGPISRAGNTGSFAFSVNSR